MYLQNVFWVFVFVFSSLKTLILAFSGTQLFPFLVRFYCLYLFWKESLMLTEVLCSGVEVLP